MSGSAASWWDRLPRPLDPFGSFKVKMGLLVGGAITLAAFTFWIGASWQFRYALLAALATSLILTQFLAHGMTSPLRQMTAAARAMARGDYSRRVRATSRDEIGQLATAFNQMAADLGAEDEYRRGLIANVSHELRTPITALHAVLENVVDGVAEPDTETMRVALAQTERLGELVANLLDLSRVEGGVIALQLKQFSGGRVPRDAVAHARRRPTASTSRSRVAAGPGRGRRSRPPASGGGQPGGQRDSTQPDRRSGVGSRVVGRLANCESRSPTRGRASQPQNANGSSSDSPAAPRRRVAPDSVWRSPAGRSNYTAGQSKSWTAARVAALV